MKKVRFPTPSYGMASIYSRKDSKWLYISYQKANGEWDNKKTGYLRANAGDRTQAKRLAQKQTEIEQARLKPTAAGAFTSWVPKWLQDTYGGRETTTYDVFRRTFRQWERFFNGCDIENPAQVQYQTAHGYRDWRLEEDIAVNTVINETKFAAIMMEEARRRGYCSENPFRRLGLKKTPTEGRIPWTSEQLDMVHKSLQRPQTAEWMLVSWVLGLYQAARLRQCEVPLAGISLENATIFYPKSIMKGKAKDHHQPLDPKAIRFLEPIIKRRKKEGHSTLCDFPKMPSLLWRRWLDEIDPSLENISHHGLRSTWITQAALSGKIPEAAARAFVGHGSGEVHRIYIKIRPDQIAHVPSLMSLPSFS